MLKTNALQIHVKDNVAIATQKIASGETIAIGGKKTIVAVEDIAAGHKIALSSIAKGEKVYRYGEAIAEAVGDIKPGEWVHVHNTKAYPR